MLMKINITLPETIKIVRNNIVETMHPLRLKLSDCGDWCDREVKETILYTGCLYSTMEIIYSKGNLFSIITGTPDKSILPKIASKFMKLGPLYRKVIYKDGGRIFDIPRKALEILDKIGYDVGCLKEEPYVGVLLYELGFEKDFIEYSRKLVKLFRELGVKRIITLDPHTYEILKYVVPKYLDDFDIEIENILDIIYSAIIDNTLRIRGGGRYVFHDPCHYSKSRFRKIIDLPRDIIKSAGGEINEILRSREKSMCCGGPIETYFSNMAKEVAKRRLQDLKSANADKIIVACPICYTSLASVSDNGDDIIDLIEFVYDSMV